MEKSMQNALIFWQLTEVKETEGLKIQQISPHGRQ